MASPIKYIVIGAGNRGSVYGLYAAENPDIATVVGVAEPRPYNRNVFLKTHTLTRTNPDGTTTTACTIPSENVFSDWRDVVARDKFADAVVIATPDIMHAEPAIAFAKKGYHILVEKPMAIKEEECVAMVQAAKQNNVILAVGHVMRYTPYTQKIKELVDSGIIGEVMNIQHLEPVGHWHFAHSYVRGNWRNEASSTFSLMAKSCHDIDWIRYMMGVPCNRVSSFGSLLHFKKENKPTDAGDAKRCLDCKVNNECPYSATKVYLDKVKQGHVKWPVNIITTSDPTVESVTEALTNGPYGRCVYESDNDVCDNQVVNLEFEGGKTVSFSMVAFTKEICVRKTRIFGTHGEIEGDGHRVKVHDFRGKESFQEYHPTKPVNSQMSGHEYGDWYLMRSFVEAVATKDPSKILSGPDETLESHLLVFAAEKARKEGIVVDTTFAKQTAQS